MKLVIVHFHYKTPEKGGALRSYFIAHGLNARGFDIEVITTHESPNYELRREPFPVHLLPVKYNNRYGLIRRVRAFLRFNRLAYRLLNTLEKPDLLYCISTPLTTGLVGSKARERLKIPFVFEVGDLWPDAPVQMGVIRNSWLARYLYSMEARIYSESERIIALSPSIADAVEKKAPGKNISLIPNMADTEFFHAGINAENEFMPEYDFLIGCIGAIGKANHLEYLVRAAEFLHEEQVSVGFIVMGEGAETGTLIKLSKDLPNIRFLPFSNRKVVKSVLESVQAIYVSYHSIPVLETGSPNKFFDGLAAGKLVITNFGGWIAQLVERHNCGFSYDPQDPAELLEKLHPYLHDAGLLRQSSVRALELADDFEKEKLLNHLADDLSATQVFL